MLGSYMIGIGIFSGWPCIVLSDTMADDETWSSIGIVHPILPKFNKENDFSTIIATIVILI